MTMTTTHERYRGCLMGLAAGDALGTTLEFAHPGSFTPIHDMIGGGPFHLKPGAWTDDTSMALCLAESLVTRQEFDPRDQMERYLRWWQEGHLSSTGACFDIGNATSSALRAFQQTREPFSGITGKWAAGNGSLMRLAPVPMAFANDPQKAVHLSGESSRTTHAEPVCIDACRYYGGLIAAALNGASREDLISPGFTPFPNAWASSPLHPLIAEIAGGSYKTRQPPEIQGSGYVVRTLEAALWAFYHSSSFEEGALKVVNLGDDADTTGAVYGQLAGAFYGEAAIPPTWRDKIAMAALIQGFADRLYEFCFGS